MGLDRKKGSNPGRNPQTPFPAWLQLPQKVIRLTRMSDSLSDQGQVGHTGTRAAKYPNVKSPDKRESVSMKKPCAESIR
jgi:hypothetical protein